MQFSNSGYHPECVKASQNTQQMFIFIGQDALIFVLKMRQAHTGLKNNPKWFLTKVFHHFRLKIVFILKLSNANDIFLRGDYPKGYNICLYLPFSDIIISLCTSKGCITFTI